MFTKLALAAAGAAVLATGVTTTASARTASAPAIVNAPPAACKAHQSGKDWQCIKPGSYCPASAKNNYGYPENSKQRYQCAQAKDNRLHWKRA